MDEIGALQIPYRFFSGLRIDPCAQGDERAHAEQFRARFGD
jgi:hypothetical protein